MSVVDGLVEFLKKELKLSGYTYKDIAHELGMSEVGVKRAFSKKTFSLRQFEEICSFLGCSFRDAIEATEPSKKLVQMSSEQELELASNDELFLFFYLLQANFSIETIPLQWHFTPDQCEKFALRLDRIGLIELHQSNRIKRIFSRNIRWQRNGPLIEKYKEKILREFFSDIHSTENDELTFRFANISADNMRVMRRKLEKLNHEFDELACNEPLSGQEKAEATWLLCCLKPWSMNFTRAKRKN